MKREPLGRAEKWCLAATIGCAVPLVVAPIWWRAQNADVVVSIPDVKLPSPNAYDFDVAASRQIVGEQQLNYAVYPRASYGNSRPIPAMPNSAATRPSVVNGPAPMQNRDYTTKEKLWLLNQNAPALQTLRKGFAFPYRQPPSRSDQDAFGLGSDAERHYLEFRKLARVLILESQLEKARGDWNGVINSCLDGVRLGTDIPRGAPLLGALSGQNIEKMTRSNVWPAISHLSAAQVRRAQLRLQSLQDHRVPCAETLQQEKWAAQFRMMQAFRDPNWRNMFSSAESPTSFSTRMRLSFISKQEVIDLIGRNLDAQIADARLPYSRRSHPAPPKPDDLMELLRVGDLSQAAKTEQCDTQNALLITALALQCFKTEHGIYPITLNALVPRYLKTVPLDPFSNGQVLRYKLKPLRYVSDIRQLSTGRQIPVGAPGAMPPSGTGAPLPLKPMPFIAPKMPETKSQIEYSNWPYTLYSIGSDGKDDGGQPTEDASNTTSTRGRYSTALDNPGDIVAGVNTG